MWTAAGVVAALAAALIVLLGRSAPGPPTASSVAPGSVGSRAGPTSTVTAPAAARPDTATLVAAARQALRAWAAFASTGDLRAVRPFFWPDGPQYRQFQREAAQDGGAPHAGPPYDYQLSSPSVQADSQRPTVRGIVTARRLGSDTATFAWEFFLRYDPAARRWRVWMVIPTSPTTSSQADSG